ncbi:DinB family protein [Portibacter lacus]|uniref:DinB-like domain-containing protein n=1 Tax=Portibacter lacus TaxID=1099794 RepID=A0AA37SNJ9_9BACT|nr:DinB family protein [Portibacter lacus]GLR16372.1 hypothetical protein GCM10007940_09870 [Portibacter lacus]
MKNPAVLYAEKLMNIIISSVSLLESLGPEFLDGHNENQKWTYKEILGHLIDSAYHNHQRIVLTLTEKHMSYQSYDQDQWVALNQYKLRGGEEVIQTFISAQQHLAILIAGIPKDELLKEYSEHHFDKMAMNKLDPSIKGTLSFLVWDYIFHLEHHLAQIIKGYIVVNEQEYYK